MVVNPVDREFLVMAYNEAKKAYVKNEIPVGCVIVYKNKVIACGYNKKEGKNNALLHAEMVAINRACAKLNSWRLDECEMYVTLEPCMMCLGAIIESRIKKVYFGTKNNIEQMYDNNKISRFVELYNANDVDCSKILTDFFKNKREK